ncbi:MAG: hypothetical protein K0R17_2159 [Rariglobus sp.]|jgi:nucleoredoxin|nr:hypothetical protein [Rariglobus sp.]
MKYFAWLAALSLTAVAFGKLETWTNLDGKSMEAELVSADDNHVSFRKADGSGYLYPFAKLSEADQKRVRESAPTAPAGSLTAPAAPVQAGKLTSEIVGKLVTLKSNTLAPFGRENVMGAKYYALYFSAQWCPPCRGFTPELVNAYKDLKAAQPGFEVIFVSNDNSKDDMQTYMSEYKMPWPAIRFDAVESLSAIQRYSGDGIPNLVFVTADGEILSSSYVGGNYVGPRKVLRDIQKKFAPGS